MSELTEKQRRMLGDAQKFVSLHELAESVLKDIDEAVYGKGGVVMQATEAAREALRACPARNRATGIVALAAAAELADTPASEDA